MPLNDDPQWWRSAVVYQVYPRSFADADGDGTGDVQGIIDKLDYLADLGVDAVWVSPWYPSPLADGGYDVSDYRGILPEFGTLEQADAFVARAHELGMRVLIDLVPNHSSDEHAWFQAALAAAPGSAERDLYLFRDGLGENGELPPNNWPAMFGGGAWERTTNADGTAGSVVPAPVRHQAARLELGQPGGRRRVRRDPAVLVRPGRRRLPDRRGQLDGQGSRSARPRPRSRHGPAGRQLADRHART